MHLKHQNGSFEKVPYFSLPANDLTEVIAPSCYACFDYPNALADLVRSPWQSAPRHALTHADRTRCIAGTADKLNLSGKQRMHGRASSHDDPICCRWWGTWACRTTTRR